MKRRDAIRHLGVGAALPLAADLSFVERLPWVGGLSFEELLDLGSEVRSTMTPAPLAAFDGHQAQTVTELADLILPATDTPSATEVGVVEFIDRIVAEWYTEEERARFLDGLAALDQRSRQLFQVDFAEAQAAEREVLVGEMDQAVQAVLQAERELPEGSASEARESFFYQVKRLTLTGYFTSEAGMTEVLRYRIVPGAYEPCIPLDR